VVALIVVPALFLAMSGLARAATLTVTNTNDTGGGSLRDEILAALPGDTINFSVSGTITLGSALPAIAINLTNRWQRTIHHHWRRELVFNF
jgi:hypothetical protein